MQLKKLALALVSIFTLMAASSAFAVDNPGDPDQGSGNDPPSQTGSKQGGQKDGPGREGGSGP